MGTVVDHEKQPLEFVAIAITNPKDSILIRYTSTDKFGKFELKSVPGGKFNFNAHLVGFNMFYKSISLNEADINMGLIELQPGNELEEVVLNAISPVLIKKDTVSYNTKAFKIRNDDVVEDLLKKLPGIEVDAAGKVTAQGEEITKIYVDDKEFFSGDPSIATKNLSADAIESIEVIDEKSEKARVSGVNDNDRSKVINLKLKEGKKVNDFGKFQGGYGTDDRYLTGLNYNRFSSKLQVSIIGKLNNVNTSGSDISDIMSFRTGGGGRFSSSSGNTANAGFLTTGAAGLNLGYEIKKNQNLNADYFYNYTNFDSGLEFTTRTEYIGDAEILSEIKSNSENISHKNTLNFNYRDRSKPLSSTYIRGSVSQNNNDNFSQNLLDKFNAEGQLDLQSIGVSKRISDNGSGNILFRHTKRFNEESRRHLSSYFQFSGSNAESTRSNDQINTFNISDPDNQFTNKEEIIKKQDLENINTTIKFSYTEPLNEHHFFELGAGFNYKNTDDDVDQLRLKNDTIVNPLIYQQYYKNNNLSGELKYKFDKNDFTLSAGATLVQQTLKFGLENLDELESIYTNINPAINFRYRPKRGKFMNFRANRSINLPSLNQLSPVINDFDPLFIRQGNPELSPEEKYGLTAVYVNHNFSSGFTIFTKLDYNYTNNSIVNTEFTNQLGIRYSSYENLGNKNNVSLRANFRNRLNTLGIRYNFLIRGAYDEYLTIINQQVNETISKDGTFGFSIENDKKDVLDAIIGASWQKNVTSFTSGRNADREYLQQAYYAKLDWNTTDRLNINSQFTYNRYTDSNFDSDQSVPIWNASISYDLNSSKSLNIMISALDILNKNIGIVRRSSDNYFEETQREVLGNYYMLSLTYNLNGNKNPKGNDGRKGHGEGRRMRF